MAEAPKDTEQKNKLDIDWLKTAAGALAAVTTAVLLSTLGAVGTLVGAALGSVAATIGTSLYAQGLARSKQTVAKVQETALLKVGIAQAEVRRAGRRAEDEAALEAHLDAADERLAEAKADLAEVVQEETGRTWSDRFRGLPWKRIALLAAATFVVVLLAITAFEQLSGRSVSSYTGGSSEKQGSTIGGVTGDEGGPKEKDKDNDQQPSEQPSQEPAPTEPTPTEEPTPQPSGTPTPLPSETPAPTPSPTLPTDLPTGSPTP